jgi:hypothetical protein
MFTRCYQKEERTYKALAAVAAAAPAPETLVHVDKLR